MAMSLKDIKKHHATGRSLSLSLPPPSYCYIFLIDQRHEEKKKGKKHFGKIIR
jgi:hypothetical protein